MKFRVGLAVTPRVFDIFPVATLYIDDEGGSIQLGWGVVRFAISWKPDDAARA